MSDEEVTAFARELVAEVEDVIRSGSWQRL